MKNHDSARAVIKDGAIVIKLPLKFIANAVQGGVDMGAIDPPLKVIDPKAFGKEVCLALNAEDDQGTTPIHALLDRTFMAAAEDGAEGVLFGNYDEETGDIDWNA